MTVYGLIRRHESKHPYSCFFERETLKFFGERISEMRVLKDTVTITKHDGTEVTCYVLSSLQRKNPSGAKRAYHYFDCETFDHVIV